MDWPPWKTYCDGQFQTFPTASSLTMLALLLNVDRSRQPLKRGLFTERLKAARASIANEGKGRSCVTDWHEVLQFESECLHCKYFSDDHDVLLAELLADKFPPRIVSGIATPYFFPWPQSDLNSTGTGPRVEVLRYIITPR